MTPTTKDPATRPQRTTTPAESGGAPAPDITPEQIIGAAATNGAVADAPALQPPGSAAAGIAAQAGADGVTATSAKVGGLFTSNHQSNAWVYLNAVGWRRLSPANPGAHHAMLQIARLAKDGGITVQAEEDGSVIHAIYLW